MSLDDVEVGDVGAPRGEGESPGEAAERLRAESQETPLAVETLALATVAAIAFAAGAGVAGSVSIAVAAYLVSVPLTVALAVSTGWST